MFLNPLLSTSQSGSIQLTADTPVILLLQLVSPLFDHLITLEFTDTFW